MVRPESLRRFNEFPWVPAMLIFLAAGVSVAQPGPWIARGPSGGSVYCLTPDPATPATLYAGTAHGVYKSLDGGETWTLSSAGLPDERVQTIAIDPTDSQTLYLGTITPNGVQSAGIFKSTDGAATWTPVNVGLIDPFTLDEPVDIEALAIDPANPGTILAGSRFSEIYKSVDGAATWAPVTAVGGFNLLLEVSAFSFDPANPGTVLAASTQGLIISTDDGDDWASYGDAPIPFYCLARDPTNPKIIYAGNQQGSGIAKSSNNGANWLTANNDLPIDSSGTFPIVLGLAVDPSNSSTVYAATFGDGFFRSVDAGSHWTTASAGMRTAFLTGVLPPVGSSPLYATTSGGGVYASQDSAGTWQERSSGINLSQIAAVVAAPSSGRLFAAAFDGVHRTDDSGQTWQPMSSGLPVFPVTSLVFAGSGALLAGTGGGGIYQTVDGGVSWTNPAQGIADADVSSLAADPSNPSTIYAGTNDTATNAANRVYKSTDSGVSWTQTGLDAGTSTIDAIAVNPGNPSQIAAVTLDAATYSQSGDGGTTWNTITPPTSCGFILTAFYEPGGSTIDLGTTAGVCRSTDGGTNWTALTVAAGVAVQVLAADPSSSGTIYAGGAPAIPYEIGGVGGVFTSSDGGQTWQAVGSGLSTASITSFAFEPASHLVHAGINGGGVATFSLQAPVRPSIDPPTPGSRTTHIVSR